MEADLDTYRALLRDIPTNPGFTDSVRLGDEAFGRGSGNPLSVFFDGGDDIDFYGRTTLSNLFGENFVQVLSKRERFSAGPLRVLPGGLRRKVHQFAVVGFRPSAKGDVAHAHAVIFRRVPALAALHHPEPSHCCSPEAESIRLRSGLMNRRQAHLMANHLNRYRRSSHFDEALNWRVVVGPAPDASAREWLNRYPASGLFLREQHGALADRGFGRKTMESICIYGLETAQVWDREQVFSRDVPRPIPPSRYEILGSPVPGTQGLAPEFRFVATRQELDPHAAELAAAIRAVGCLPGESDYVASDDALAAIWGGEPEEDDGAPPDGPRSADPVSVYALSLSRSEAVSAMRILRSMGYRDLQLRKVGRDGEYVRDDEGHPHFWNQQVTVNAVFPLAGQGGTHLLLRGQQWVPERHDPIECWPEWALFAVDHIDENREGNWL